MSRHRRPHRLVETCDQCGHRRDYTPEAIAGLVCFLLAIGCIVWAVVAQ